MLIKFNLLLNDFRLFNLINITLFDFNCFNND